MHLKNTWTLGGKYHNYVNVNVDVKLTKVAQDYPKDMVVENQTLYF